MISILPQYRMVRIEGQIPDMEAIRQASRRPEEWSEERLFAKPIIAPQSVLEGLGLDLTQEADWIDFLERYVASSPNEILFRQAVSSKLFGSDLGEKGFIILSRANQYWREFHKGIRHFHIDLCKSMTNNICSKKCLLDVIKDESTIEVFKPLVKQYEVEQINNLIKSCIADGQIIFNKRKGRFRKRKE